MESPVRLSRTPPVVPATGDDLPEERAWWFHSSPLSLDDPLAPLPKAALEGGTWKPFSKRDCDALERGWERLPEHIKRREERVPDERGVVDELAVQRDREKAIKEEEVEDVSQDELKVVVGAEQLHHVDLIAQT